MARKSTKALNAFLATLNHPKPVTLGALETYGKDTRAYVSCPPGMSRAIFEAKLEEAGFTINSGWSQGCEWGTEIEVSYRKAKGWDE